jgi:beta-glucanase (GH16 family)
MIRTTLVALLAASAGSVAHAQWSLVFQEEFDGSSLNLSNWEPMIGTGTAYGGQAGWGNNELQYYTNLSSNIVVSNGTLKIIARQQSFGGQPYTSARLRTLNKVDFKWGRVEGRIKLPSTQGIWPAFWMLPTGSPYGGWAASGEIDIMESTGLADRMHGTIHHGGQWPSNTSNGGSIQTGLDYSADFHTFAIEWDPAQIRWYLDGVQYYSVNASTWFSSTAPTNDRAPFDSTFHLLLNVAVGGNWPGNPNASSVFPQTMEVDWVRVYRREQIGYSGQPTIIPGQIESEHYDLGYPGEAYNDSDYGNNGSALRTDDVDIEICTEGGHNVGWLRTGEWLEYTVDVAAAGEYLLEARVASQSTGGQFRIDSDGTDLTGPVTAPITGGWQTWQTVSTPVTLEAGPQVLRFAKLGTTGEFNINWLRLTQVGGCSAADLAEPYGSLNFFDVSAFLGAFNTQSPDADLAEPTGVWNFFDVSAFLGLFNAGCP